jgi:hypothetical protein
MKTPKRMLVMAFAALLLSNKVMSQGQYTIYELLVKRTEQLTKANPSVCAVKTLVKTAGDKDIMVISIGTGDMDKKPAIAVVGGVDGGYILSRELALGFAERIVREASTPEIKSLLDKVSFYVFPDVSPDASAQFFARIKYERNINTRPVDDDRDFKTNEDPFEDLNNDGYITQIRVSDPAGNYIECPDDKRVMTVADLSKGEKGAYFVYTEGIDNDKDGKFNEDGDGGVNFNRNLTFNYEEFGSNAGLHPVSEPEVKAVLDFLFDHFNIIATISFGPQDNLSQSAGGDRGKGNQSQQGNGTGQQRDAGSENTSGEMPRMRERRISSVMKTDETVIKLVADKYREITGIKGNAPVRTDPGNFMDWSYYHYGRYSFSTPAWWFPADKEKNYDASFLKYAEENKIEDVFVPWTTINDPDFPGKKVEVGGIKPFAEINPPVSKIDDLVTANYKFVTAIAALHPELEFLDLKVEPKGDDVYRLSLKIHNKGTFATTTEAGDVNMWTRRMRLTLEPGDKQKFLSGQKIQPVPRLEGDKSLEFSWLIMGKGTVKVSAGAVNTGFITTAADLK